MNLTKTRADKKYLSFRLVKKCENRNYAFKIKQVDKQK